MKPLNVTYYSCKVKVHLNYIFLNLCFVQIIHKEIGFHIEKKCLKMNQFATRASKLNNAAIFTKNTPRSLLNHNEGTTERLNHPIVHMPTIY